MSASTVMPSRTATPPLSPQKRLQDVRSRIIRSNLDLIQQQQQGPQLTPLKSSFGLRYDTKPQSQPQPQSTTVVPPKLKPTEQHVNYKHPDMDKIEHRLVNKELELKRVLINFILFLSSKLLFNFISLTCIKMELAFDVASYNKYLHFLHLLFFYNIGMGIYRVLKPQDQFKDLQLTPHQRELLGLTPIPLRSVDISPQPVIKTSTTTAPTTATTTTKEKPSRRRNKVGELLAEADQPQRHIKTPIASPMASSPIKKFTASPSKSPLRFEQKPQTVQNPMVNKLKQNVLNATPTYIPSPKYYYRMDSPTKARRRV